jgi:hypothetical protein
MPATLNATAVRFHLSLNVSDLGRSVDFYRALFRTEPAKRRADYAKFELPDPPLVVSLEPNRAAPGGALNHAGFRLPDAAALVELQRHLEGAGIRTRRQEGVECCYARQTKFWVTDPDQTLWEVYVLEEDLDHRGAGQTLEEMLPAAAAAAPTPVVWEHQLGRPFPRAIPLADGAADEVRLLGTFNAPPDDNERRRILAEAHRVLRPGGQVFVHVLVADKPFAGAPALPGPAAAVRHVPVESEPVKALEAGGFGGLRLTKFGPSACFQLGGVEMRELKLSGWKLEGNASGAGLPVVYKGPFLRVVDDAGNVYRRGERVAVAAGTGRWLRQEPYAEHFTPIAAGEGVDEAAPVRARGIGT